MRIQSVNYLRATDELLFVVTDASGTSRLLATDRAGSPHRAVGIGALPFPSDLAQIPAGNANAGDLGAVHAEPSQFYRVAQP